jgi:hypothetical protein
MPTKPFPDDPTREVLHYRSWGQATYLAQHHFALNANDQAFDSYPIRYRLRQGAPVSIYTHPTTGAAREEWAYHPDPKAFHEEATMDYRSHFSPKVFHHRDDAPAIIERDRYGDLTEHWYRHGKAYEPTAHERMKWEATKLAKGPFHAETMESLAGGEPLMGATREVWSAAVGTTGTATADYPLHREDGPAVIEKDPATGRVVWLSWYENNQDHRIDGPATQIFDETTGVCVQECHYRRGRLHRTDGPAEIQRDPQGNTTLEEWRRNGVAFRQNGPWLIERDAQNPQRVFAVEHSWFLNGRRLDKPTPRALHIWQEMVQQQGGLFTQSADQVPARPQRTGGVKAAAAAAAAKVAEAPKTKTATRARARQEDDWSPIEDER